MLWKKYGNQFSRLSPFEAFCCLFSDMDKTMRKHAFPIWWSIPQEGNLTEKHPYYGNCMGTNFPGFPRSMTFAAICHAMGNWWENTCIPIWWSVPQDGNLMGKKHPYCGKSMSTNFPVYPHAIGFVAFSCVMGNKWGNPSVSHMMKYTIGRESDGKKPPILWETY